MRGLCLPQLHLNGIHCQCIAEFPVWALPALGLILSFFSTFVLWFIAQGAVYYIVMVPLFSGWPEDLALAIGMALLGEMVSTVILAGVLAGLLLLTAGAGLYLAAQRRWKRALALVVPVVLSEAVMSLRFYQAYPAEAWANPADASARLWEALQPFANPLPILLLLAALVPRLPWSGGREPASSPAPNAPVQGSE